MFVQVRTFDFLKILKRVYSSSLDFRLVDGTDESEGKYELLKRWSFGGNVEAIEFTPDSNTLIVSARNDNYLNYIDLHSFEVKRVNMNSNGDNHVSFTAMHLQCSPSGNHLLVQTDRDRIIVMRTHTPLHVNTIFPLFTYFRFSDSFFPTLVQKFIRNH